MKMFFTVIMTVLFFGLSFSQQTVTDVSPDGAQSNTYIYTPGSPGSSSINNYQDVPYGSAPSWNAMRDRQIGGLAFGDYDNDGDLDLAVGCYSSNSYPPINEYENFIFRNNNGVLDTLPAWITADERSTTDVRWADVNMDGKPDLLSANGLFQHSTLYLNSDTGLTRTHAWISNDNVFTVGAAFNDIDGDGDLDLALGNQGIDPLPHKPIQVFYNNNGILETTPSWSSGDQMITNSVAFADLNNSDLTQHNVTYTASGTAYSFLLPMTPVYSIDVVTVNGSPQNNFTFDPLNCWLALGYKPAAGSQVDITYTYVKHGDLAAAKWVYFSSGVYFNNNSVLYPTPGWTVPNTETEKGIAWADIDLDGFMDLAIGGSGGPNTIYKNNNGVLSSTPYWSSTGTNTSVQDLIWGDVNKDGYPDLAVVHFGYKRTDIYINRGGTLDVTATWSYIASTSATTIAFGDVNGDGWLDLAIGTARQPVMLFIADSSLVPVEFSAFSASSSGSEVLLQWSTSTEKNNYGFHIERRTNSSSEWKQIGFVPGNGTTTEEQVYQYKDKPAGTGVYFYRLKQADYDGSITYSKIIQTEVIPSLYLQLEQNYPNPFNPETKISYYVPFSDKGLFITLKLYDVLGREAAELVSEEQSGGEYEITLNANELGLSSGVYFYALNAGDLTLTKKIILSK